MMGTAASLDRVAQALGVSTDEGIVERLTPVARRLDAVVNLIPQQRSELAGAVPNADEVIAVAMGHLQDAVVYVTQVSRAAEDHRRGER